MYYQHGIIRKPPQTMSSGITSQAVVVDFDQALKQHHIYCQTLEKLGIKLHQLPANESYPDSHFVEDTAVICNQHAVLMRPGAEARLGEVAAIKPSLKKLLPVHDITDLHATIDGGDVLIVGNKALIGISHRTNLAGANALANHLRQIHPDITIHFIAFSGVLHLKSGIVALNEDTLLANPRMHLLDTLPFPKIIWLPDEEAYAANALVANKHALVFAECKQTQALIAAEGITPIALDMSEFRKMDGSFTCLSLLW